MTSVSGFLTLSFLNSVRIKFPKMFKCMFCANLYVFKDDFLKHVKTHGASSYSCALCSSVFTRQNTLYRHIRNVHKSTYHIRRCHNATRMDGANLSIARPTVIHWAPPASAPDAEQQTVPPLGVTVTHKSQHTTIPSRGPALVHEPDITPASTATVVGGGSPPIMPNHYSENFVENINIQKESTQSVKTGFIEFDSSTQRLTVWYLRKNIDNITSCRDFLRSIETELVEKLQEHVLIHPIKYDLKLETTYVIPDMDNISVNRSFKSPATELFVHSYVENLVDGDITHLLAKVEEHVSHNSMFTLSSINGLLLAVHQYNSSIDGWSYLPLPESIICRRAVVNPQSIDAQCFKWAILAKHVSKSRCRVGVNYFSEEHRYDFSALSIPTPMSEITLFERANPDTSVNIYGLKNSEKTEKSSAQLVVYPLRVSDKEMSNHFDLLLITGPENKNHYTYISNFSRLVSAQLNLVNNHKRRLYFCKKCFKSFDYQPLKNELSGKEALAQHRLEDKCVFDPNTALLPCNSINQNK